MFASAASSLLEEDGRFACIISPDRLQDMLAALNGAGLTPYLLQYIHKQKTSPATFVLIEARKGAHAKPSVAESPCTARNVFSHWNHWLSALFCASLKA